MLQGVLHTEKGSQSGDMHAQKGTENDLCKGTLRRNKEGVECVSAGQQLRVACWQFQAPRSESMTGRVAHCPRWRNGHGCMHRGAATNESWGRNNAKLS